MEVGQAFDSFSEVEAVLGELRTHQYHSLRVYNSQTATDYNKKRLSAKNPVEPVDTDKFRYTYYSTRYVHYGNARHRGPSPSPSPSPIPSPNPSARRMGVAFRICLIESARKFN